MNKQIESELDRIHANFCAILSTIPKKKGDMQTKPSHDSVYETEELKNIKNWDVV